MQELTEQEIQILKVVRQSYRALSQSEVIEFLTSRFSMDCYRSFSRLLTLKYLEQVDAQRWGESSEIPRLVLTAAGRKALQEIEKRGS